MQHSNCLLPPARSTVTCNVLRWLQYPALSQAFAAAAAAGSQAARPQWARHAWHHQHLCLQLHWPLLSQGSLLPPAANSWVHALLPLLLLLLTLCTTALL